METPVLDPMEAYALWAAAYPPWAHNPLMQAEERAMLALMPTDLCGQAICDAGCGSGRYLLHAQRRGAANLIGLDLSKAMLHQARELARTSESDGFRSARLVCANINALPLASAFADVTLCGLTLGHLPDLDGPLSELRRITRPGGMVLCSELHPIGEARGWQRTFKVDGKRFAVQHHWRTLEDWAAACQRVGLSVVQVREPRLDPADIPAGAHFDADSLSLPAAVVFQLRRDESVACV